MMKQVKFHGSALGDLRSFPAEARREAGFQINQLQEGRDPDDWKPMRSIGQGVREIRISDRSGAFRVIYIAQFLEAIHILHCFQKKSQKTAIADLRLAGQRLRELMTEKKR